ncbi:DUF5908 family protein [Mongoliitalea daihaiensis]|uniref:DUF5908 family protein n=1 Tax=Mongoliitalea daihaiensis TaxID=2782006 RepID=UPI001F42F4A8|nr:DUF5908 family protein [Mongoliitalea daihaiensis]UJP63798.1 hypothetical protein IPZ59_13285 [Mongoliitalea daihaiensis]
MPIEIRELHIKVNVTPEREQAPRQSSATGKDIVQEVVEAVMETIERKKER